ncbi:TonB-dependent receptor, partial [candidate division GN15 bacterium]|nr:TonB-dependent receptor [candidate division GN15 bacterium]
MNPKVLLLTLVLVCVVAGIGFGATTGKITGVITDAQTGEPLVGATVIVDGTNLGASTDADGRYIILNVPVGEYTLRISSVGYGTLEVQGVNVSVDLATYQDHSLSSKATDIGRTITVRAERPLIIKDKTTTVDVVSREELLALPTRGFEQVVGIQNSVVRMNTNTGIGQRGGGSVRGTGSEINLRGGRPSEVAYYVDGFSTQDPLSGVSSANISNNAIKEVSVTSGAFSAEYGHVASGVVNVTTNSGTDQFRGNFEAVSDNIASPFGYDSFDQNYYSGDIGGPIPGLEDGYFFFSGERRYLGDRTPSSATKDVYESFGIDTLKDENGNLYFAEPQRMPANALKGWSYQGKLDYDFTPNIKLALTGSGSTDRWQNYSHFYLNPRQPNQVKHAPLYEDQNLGLNAKITHTLNAKTFYNLSASYFVTERKRGDGVIFDKPVTMYSRDERNPFYDGYNLFRSGAWRVIDGDSVFYESFYTSPFKRESSYYGLKGDITSQLNAHNTLKLGFDLQRHTVRQYLFLGADDGFTEGLANSLDRFGYDSLGTKTDDEDFQHDEKHPINLGLYVQERFEWRGLIVNAGLRFDYFDYRALRVKNPARPFDPDGTLLDDNPNNDELASVLDFDDLEDSEQFTRLSPRLGVSFPVSASTQMHINYGKFFQRPDLNRLYTGMDFYEARVGAGSYYPFPSPNLEPEEVTQYEVGLTQQLGDFTAVDITAYYKDIQDQTQILHISPATPFAYDVYGNSDYGTVKGVDFGLTMRRVRNVSMSIKYTLASATGTGSYAGSTYNVAW